jgi:hypothetical protein
MKHIKTIKPLAISSDSLGEGSMHQRKLLISVLALSLTLIAVLPVTRADWVYNRCTFEGSFNVYPVNFQAAVSDLEVGYKERISFNCTSGGDRTLNFFICDEENFNLWLGSQPFEAYCRHDMVISWSGEFEPPYEATWYHVFANFHDPITRKSVDLIIDLYEWQDPLTPSMNPVQRGILAGVILAALGGIFFAIIVMWHRRRPQDEEDYWATRREVRSPPPPAPYPPGTCPRCQTALEAEDGYCYNCGERL